MNIIEGLFKRKVLLMPPRTARPTKNRVRKALFDILAHRYAFLFEGKRVLDLCAGSGILGFEAASRGAGRVIFVDLDLSTVNKNFELLGKKPSMTQIKADIMSLQELPVFDLAFFDPPYENKALIEKGLSLLMQHKGLICFECDSHYQPPFPGGDRRTYGNSAIVFWDL